MVSVQATCSVEQSTYSVIQRTCSVVQYTVHYTCSVVQHACKDYIYTVLYNVYNVSDACNNRRASSSSSVRVERRGYELLVEATTSEGWELVYIAVKMSFRSAYVSFPLTHVAIVLNCDMP